jgi:hypothetical protein
MSEPLHGDNMTTEDWLAWAGADAVRRGLPELKPLLEALADAQRRLRAADWNEDAAGRGADAGRPDAARPGEPGEPEARP